MREFMVDHGRDTLPLLRRGEHRIDEEVDHSVGDQSPVFHGSHGELGDGDHVELGERIAEAEEAVVQVEAPAGDIEGIRARGALARRGVHLDEHAVLGALLDVVELAHAEGEKIGGHLRRGHEGDHALAPFLDDSHLLLWHVAEAREVAGHDQREVEDRLPRRFVPARKRTAGVQGLELRGAHDLLLAVGCGVVAAIEAGHLIVEVALVAHGQDRFCVRRELFVQRERARRELDIEGDGLRSSRLAVEADCRIPDQKLLAVEHHLARGTDHIQRDARFASESEALQIRFNTQGVVPRLQSARKQHRLRHV
mmetsp:Transcript_4817/g.19309  ORF Transcript_4817/g.19309 Transcript_4817/m.19309 type:complete len:310 (+) Transcript_4817:2850-3779(+)